MSYTEDDLRQALLLLEQRVPGAQTIERDATDEADELLLADLVTPARVGGRRPRRALLVGTAAVIAAAAVVAGIVITHALSPGSGEQAATEGWSTASVTANPSWRCADGHVPVSSYQVGFADGEPTQVELINEGCAPTYGPSEFILPPDSVTVAVEPAGQYTPEPLSSAWQAVLVNGTTGYYSPGYYRPTGGNSSTDAPATLYWAYAPNSYVVVTSEAPDDPTSVPASTLIAVAQSGIWRGKIASLPLRLSANTVPAGYEPLDVTAYATTGAATSAGIADVFFYKPSSGAELHIGITPTQFAQYESERTTATTVNGRQAVFTRSPMTLAVQLDGGTLLLNNTTNPDPADAATLTRIAAGITVVPDIADAAQWYSVAAALPAPLPGSSD